MKSQSIRFHHTSSYKVVENTPKKKCMTRKQLDVLEPHYAKNDHPTRDEIELLAEVINVPVPKVANWFNNRRAKEARLQRNSSLMLSSLSQSFWNMDTDGTTDMTNSDDDDDEHESGDAQGAPDQAGLDQEALYHEARATMAEMSPEEVDIETRAARACVLAMDNMTQEEVNVAFILSNLKRRIIVHPPKK
ncbi:hypothetical protein BDR04DRAFT_1140221 [Suillus decipiens]|nr:hypothetical protein BDR04DRAFT_1140221 [Suillus decipiens]